MRGPVPRLAPSLRGVRRTGSFLRQNGPVSQVWTTPHRSTPVDAIVSLPGSKSITARALILAALADGPSRIVRPLRARDTDLMAAGLRTLGTEITEDGPDWVVNPGPLRGPAAIDAGLAGTVLRFLPPYIITEKEVDQAVKILGKNLAKVK